MRGLLGKEARMTTSWKRGGEGMDEKRYTRREFMKDKSYYI